MPTKVEFAVVSTTSACEHFVRKKKRQKRDRNPENICPILGTIWNYGPIHERRGCIES